MDLYLGLIGSPVKHSLSPWIHDQLLERSKLEGKYELIDINDKVLTKQSIRKIKEYHLDGFNVTAPYKKMIIPYLDYVDESAMKIGAVNTVNCVNGYWTGYNTDGIGFLRALENDYPFKENFTSSSVLIIGAGGAARGIYTALSNAGFTTIDIANRTRANAEQIAQSLANGVTTNCITLEEAEEQLGRYFLIVQTTSVGMGTSEPKRVINLRNLEPNTIVSDIVYKPIMTPLLEDAKEKGAHIHFGHNMLLYQAKYSFEIWANKTVQVEGLSTKLKTILKENL